MRHVLLSSVRDIQCAICSACFTPQTLIHTCAYVRCRITFWIATGLGIVAVACAFVLYLRTRGIYQCEYLEVHMYDEEIDERHELPESVSSAL